MNYRFETIEKLSKTLTDLVEYLVDNNKRKYDNEENEKRRKTVRTYVEYQNLPHSLKKPELREFSDDDETFTVIRPHGISDTEQPDDMVSILTSALSGNKFKLFVEKEIMIKH